MSIHPSVMHQCVLRGLKFAESHRGAIVAVANAYSLEAPGCSSPESVDPHEDVHASPEGLLIRDCCAQEPRGSMRSPQRRLHPSDSANLSPLRTH